MSLSNTTKKSQWLAGGETTFAYEFKILDEDDLEVIVTDTDGVSTTKTLSSDYTVTGVGADEGGTVVFSVAPTSGYTVTLRRQMAYKQLIDLVTQGGYDSDVVETALDRLTMFLQQVDELLDRTFRTPAGDSNNFTELPAEEDRASKYLAFDGDGKPIASGGGPGSAEVPTTSFASTLLDDSDGETARATLGVKLNNDTFIDRHVGNGVLCPHEGLVLSRPSAATVDVDADAVLLTDASGNQKRFTGLNVTINLATAGAAGLDTGSEASATWYYVWALAKADGTLTAVLSTAADFASVTPPTDYLYGGLVSAVYNDGSSNLIAFRQNGGCVWRLGLEVLSGGTAGTQTAVSLAAAVPALPVEVEGYVTIQASASGQQANGTLYPDDSEAIGGVPFVWANATTVDSTAQFRLVLKDSQSMGYVVGAGDNMDISITGWRFL